MPYKFYLQGLAKFRQVAIWAIFGGYFGYFLARPLFLNSMICHFGEPTGYEKEWHNQIVCLMEYIGVILKKRSALFFKVTTTIDSFRVEQTRYERSENRVCVITL